MEGKYYDNGITTVNGKEIINILMKNHKFTMIIING